MVLPTQSASNTTTSITKSLKDVTLPQQKQAVSDYTIKTVHFNLLLV